VDFSQPTLQRIRKSGVLRVGFNADNMPFTYFSETGELIGLNIDLAQLLAWELKVKLEFVPFDYENMVQQLNTGLFDLVMSGVAVTTPRLEKMTFSELLANNHLKHREIKPWLSRTGLNVDFYLFDTNYL
jgi:ABC-type amino acid transport substrate-binding protein